MRTWLLVATLALAGTGDGPTELTIVDEAHRLPPGACGENEGALLCFAPGSAEISDDGAELVRWTAKTLSQREWWLQIEGHAATEGSAVQMCDLSRDRALAVRNELVAQGFDRAKVKVVFFGDSRPLCTTAQDNCLKINRAVEITAIGTSPPEPSRAELTDACALAAEDQ